MELSEKELIQYCIDNGIEGAKKRLKSFERNGYLDNKDVIQALIKDALQLFESCEIKKDENGKELRGKKRIYVLGKKRDEIKEREDNRKNNGAKTEENILIFSEYLMQLLNDSMFQCEYKIENKIEISLSKLIGEIEFFINPWKDITNLSVMKIIDENITGISEKVYAHHVTENLKGYFRDKNRYIVSSALNNLKNSNRIALEYKYMAYDEKLGYFEAGEEVYDFFSKRLQNILDEYNSIHNTKYNRGTISKIKAKEERFLSEHEKDLLKHLDEENCNYTLSKLNVITVLDKKFEQYDDEKIGNAIINYYLRDIRKEIDNNYPSEKLEYFAQKYFYYFVVKVLEYYDLPDWCIDYCKRYENRGFGSVIFDTSVLNDEEKEYLKKNSPYKDDEIQNQLPASM